jgi:hypothetical protein
MVRAHNVVATCNGSARCSDSLLMMIPHCTVYIIHDFLTAKELEYIDQLATENAKRFKESFTQVRAVTAHKRRETQRYRSM